MEPLKNVQVEGHLMFAEPHDLFGNLDELCYVSLYASLVINRIQYSVPAPAPARNVNEGFTQWRYPSAYVFVRLFVRLIVCPSPK